MTAALLLSSLLLCSQDLTRVSIPPATAILSSPKMDGFLTTAVREARTLVRWFSKAGVLTGEAMLPSEWSLVGIDSKGKPVKYLMSNIEGIGGRDYFEPWRDTTTYVFGVYGRYIVSIHSSDRTLLVLGVWDRSTKFVPIPGDILSCDVEQSSGNIIFQGGGAKADEVKFVKFGPQQFLQPRTISLKRKDGSSCNALSSAAVWISPLTICFLARKRGHSEEEAKGPPGPPHGVQPVAPYEVYTYTIGDKFVRAIAELKTRGFPEKAIAKLGGQNTIAVLADGTSVCFIPLPKDLR